MAMHQYPRAMEDQYLTLSCSRVPGEGRLALGDGDYPEWYQWADKPSRAIGAPLSGDAVRYFWVLFLAEDEDGVQGLRNLK